VESLDREKIMKTIYFEKSRFYTEIHHFKGTGRALGRKPKTFDVEKSFDEN